MSIDKIKELRARTGIGVIKCRAALEQSGNDVEKAIDVLKKLGELSRCDRCERRCCEGRVESYVHGDGRIGVLLQVNCESDFVANSKDFREFMHEIALQIVGARPLCVTREDIPVEKIKNETDLLFEQAAKIGKPEAIRERIVKGQLEKWYVDICLLDQPWIKDGTRNVRDLLNDLIQKTGENIVIRRFVRFEAGSA